MENFIYIDKWNYNKEDAIISYDGRIMTVRFDKFFNEDSKDFNHFGIIRDIYVKKLDLITDYLNYFIEFYDDDQEFIPAYFKLKYMIDNKKQFKDLSCKAFKKALYDILITPTIVEKIHRLVEDNYYVSLSTDEDSNKYNKELEFNDEHGKILQSISMAIKMMIPLILHFSRSRNKDINFFSFYERLFDIFSPHVNIYNKLYRTAQKKVIRDFNSNKLIWKQIEMITGTEPSLYVEELLKERLIQDTLFKYRFNNSVHSYNTAIINNQLGFHKRGQYENNMREVSHDKDATGLSAVDIMIMNMNNVDESLVILSEINANNTISKIKKRFKIEVTDDEVQYYMKHNKRNEFLIRLVYSYFAKFFGSYQDLRRLVDYKYYTLLVILKKKLIYDGCIYLPQILSSNVTGSLNSRVIRNMKTINEFERTDEYKALIEDKYELLIELKEENIILNTLSTLLNTKFTLVDYNFPDKLGEEIEINKRTLSFEFLKFMQEI